VPWLAVENEASGRRTIPWMNLSALSTRSHEHEFVGTADELAQEMITAELAAKHADTCFYQRAVVMGPCILITLQPGDVPSTDEWLGYPYSKYLPGVAGVRYQEPLTVPDGWTRKEFDDMLQFKIDRLTEIFEPRCVERIEAGIEEHWKRLRMAAPERGAEVNAFLHEHYCITVGEASYDPEEQRHQLERANLLAAQANADLARQGLPHRLVVHEGIHSAFRTFVVNKRAVAERHPATAHVGRTPAPARGVQL
jgi:hypothetical protein